MYLKSGKRGLSIYLFKTDGVSSTRAFILWLPYPTTQCQLYVLDVKCGPPPDQMGPIQVQGLQHSLYMLKLVCACLL
jgi:hypothetical protein